MNVMWLDETYMDLEVIVSVLMFPTIINAFPGNDAHHMFY